MVGTLDLVMIFSAGVTIIQFYLLYLVVYKYRKYLKHAAIFASVFIVTYIFKIIDIAAQQPNWNSNPISLVFFGRFTIFFAFGMLLSDYDTNKIRIRHLRSLLWVYVLGVLVLSLYVRSLYLTYFYPIIIFLLFLAAHNFLVKYIENHVRLIDHFGRHSMIIYLIHTNFIYHLVKPNLTPDLLALKWITLFVSVILTLFLSYAFSEVFMYLYNRLTRRFVKK